MLTIATIAQLGIATVVVPNSFAQAGPPSAEVRACIDAQAPAVERLIEPLGEATDFLVQKACAAPIVAQVKEQTRIQNEARRARMKEACDQQTDPLRRAPWCADGMDHYLNDTMFDSGAILFAQGMAQHPEATSLAAQTLLKLRLARLPTAKR